MDPIELRLRRYPSLRFKLDPTSSWTPELIDALVATNAVDSVDFKAYYTGTVVDQAPDPELYRRVVEALPDATLVTVKGADHLGTMKGFGFLDAALGFLGALPA